jgi:LysM repeat protein
MTDLSSGGDTPRSPFPGIIPTITGARHVAERQPSKLSKGLRMTLPFVVASAMTVGLNLTGPVEPVAASPKRSAKPKSDLFSTMRTLVTTTRASVGAATSAGTASTAAAAGTTYTVQVGDTIAAIAGRHSLSTASVLALNGLGWKSLIFPGQVLKLAPGASVAPAAAQEGGRHTIVAGDTISRIAIRFGVPVESLLSVNGLSWSSIIYPGQTIAIPSAPAAAPTDDLAIETVSVVTPAPAAPPTALPTTPPTTSTVYTIQSGDTISSIAARFGVTTQAVLDANGLTASSIIYPGGTLVIPAAGGSSGSSSGGVTALTSEQEGNARIIIQVGREQGVPDYGIIIALATAMQESSLRNIDYGDRDSVGLFQQRTSTGWGTIEEIMDPYHSAYLFYQGRSGYTRGLLDISGWQSMALTVAAQSVQVSAYPNAYAKWETSARAWFAALA